MKVSVVTFSDIDDEVKEEGLQYTLRRIPRYDWVLTRPLSLDPLCQGRIDPTERYSVGVDQSDSGKQYTPGESDFLRNNQVTKYSRSEMVKQVDPVIQESTSVVKT